MPLQSHLLSLPPELRHKIWSHYLDLTSTIALPSILNPSPVRFTVPWAPTLTVSHQVHTDLLKALKHKGRFATVTTDALEILHVVAVDDNYLFVDHVRFVDCRAVDRCWPMSAREAARRVATRFEELGKIIDEFDLDGSYACTGDARFGVELGREWVDGRGWNVVELWVRVEF